MIPHVTVSVTHNTATMIHPYGRRRARVRSEDVITERPLYGVVSGQSCVVRFRSAPGTELLDSRPTVALHPLRIRVLTAMPRVVSVLLLYEVVSFDLLAPLLATYGYPILFIAICLECAALPIP